MLTRIDLDDPGTVATLDSQAERHRAEPAPADRDGRAVHVPPGRGAVVNDLSPDAVIKSVHIAQGLGASSAYTWMKLPVVEEMERVMDATTLPTLLLGGDPEGARTRPTRAGRRPWRCRRCAAWCWAAPCSTRPTTTSPRPSTPPSSLVR